MKNKFMIIDGNSILFRAFYAMPPLKTKKGQYTNAVYGFLNMLYKLIDDYSPEYICVAFDPKKPTFRHEQYSEYKAGRAKAPDELIQQFDLIREVLKVHNIKCVEIEGFEADDVAGTFANFAKHNDLQTFLVTSDKDYLQLVDDDVKVLLTKKGVTNIKEMDRNQIKEDYEIDAEEFVDLKALMGDQSDNIPGVAGVGEKTAIKLIKEYHNLDNLYNHIDEIKGKLKEKLENDKMQAYMSKTLAQIIVDIPVDIDINDYKNEQAEGQTLLKLYDDLEFKLFKKRVKNVSGEQTQSANNSEKADESPQLSIFNFANTNANDNLNAVSHKPINFTNSELIYITEKEKDNIDDLKIELDKCDKMIIKFILDGDRALFSNAVGVAISTFEKNTYYIELNTDNENDVLNILKPYLENDKIEKYGQDIKSDIIYLLKKDITLKNVKFDTEIAAYLINPSENSYSLDKLSSFYLDKDIPSIKDYFGTGKSKIAFNAMDIEKRKQYVYNIMFTIQNVYKVLLDKIEELNMSGLFNNIEMPLVEVLANMEFEGFKVDEKILDSLGEKFSHKLQILEGVIYELAGEKFNINSPKQLGVILFEKLNLEVIKKTKTGYSTDVEVLEKLSDKHPIINKIIEYRQLAKLSSTYIDGLKAVIIKDTSRVHSMLNQTITATGRISSTDPNLQNIPTRTEEGKEIRRAFVAKEGCKLVDADYSQIELRVLAELSNEDKLIDAFKHHEDIHSKTASEVFKVPMEEVTSTMRSRAKAVNFGIIYGISDFGLARDLSIPRKEAKEYIENYLGFYQNIDNYMKQIVEQGKIDLYVETYFGRRRNVPDLASRNFHIRSAAERIALNTPVQGTAADIIKMAMINVFNRLKNENLKSKLLLQVHDELIIEAYEDEVEEVKNILKDEMENVVTNFKVKLDVDIEVGDNWYESK